jgi:hypothetical protein
MNPFFGSLYWLEIVTANAMGVGHFFLNMLAEIFDSKQMFYFLKELMAFLSSIIAWLMNVPGGLKLNKQLTEFLGRFFMYHIYLWNSEYFRIR